MKTLPILLLTIVTLSGCKTTVPNEGKVSLRDIINNHIDSQSDRYYDLLKQEAILYPLSTPYPSESPLEQLYMDGYECGWDKGIGSYWIILKGIPRFEYPIEGLMVPEPERNAWLNGHVDGYLAGINRLIAETSRKLPIENSSADYCPRDAN